MRQELLTTESYATAIMESIEDAILTKDVDGVISSCNPATQRIFGYEPDELIGRPVRILIPDERQAEEDDILRRLKNGERVRGFETVRVTKDATRIDVLLTWHGSSTTCSTSAASSAENSRSSGNASTCIRW